MCVLSTFTLQRERESCEGGQVGLVVHLGNQEKTLQISELEGRLWLPDYLCTFDPLFPA